MGKNHRRTITTATSRLPSTKFPAGRADHQRLAVAQQGVSTDTGVCLGLLGDRLTKPLRFDQKRLGTTDLRVPTGI